MESLPAAAVKLRPLGLGELLDRAVTLCVRNFWVLAAVYVAYAVLVEAIGFAGGSSRVAFFNALLKALQSGKGDAQTVLAAMSAHPLPPWWLAALIAQGLLLWPLVGAALADAASSVYLERPVSVGAAYARALQCWLQILLLDITYAISGFLAYMVLVLGLALVIGLVAATGIGSRAVGLEIAVGVIFGLIAGAAVLCVVIVIGLAYQLSFYAVVLERVNFLQGFVSGLRRAFSGVGFRRSLLVGFAYWAIVIGIAIVTSIGQGVIVGITHSDILSSIFSVIVSVATSAFAAVFIVLYYYDLRVREEGFDLQATAATLAPEGSAPA